MPLISDPIFGSCYLSPEDFLRRLAAFGAQLATVNTPPESIIALLAMASRQIETYLGGKTFDGQPVTENQPWNPRTRRFPLNNPPPTEVTACKLWVAPGLYQTISLTPVINDGAGSPISWGELLYNRQLNLMEIGLLASTTIAQPVIVIAGVQHPFIEITYTPTAEVPPEVAAACGWQAAHLAQLSQANDTLPGGLSEIRTQDRTIRRAPATREKAGTATPELCKQAEALLSGHLRLAVG